jgi:hypothetical protein
VLATLFVLAGGMSEVGSTDKSCQFTSVLCALLGTISINLWLGSYLSVSSVARRCY